MQLGAGPRRQAVGLLGQQASLQLSDPASGDEAGLGENIGERMSYYVLNLNQAEGVFETKQKLLPEEFPVAMNSNCR